MRDRIRAVLGPVTHSRFLVYLMGPYEAFDLAEMVPEGVDPADLAVPYGD